MNKKLIGEELWEAIHELPEKQKEIWSLKLVNDFSHREIGDILGIKESNVNVIIHRSIKLLKVRLAHLANE